MYKRQQVLAARQSDPDSTPGNSVASEDDQASVTVTPPVVDLAVTAAVDRGAPGAGDVIRLTFNATNSAMADATGVRVSATLPDGLSVLSSQTDAGSYDADSGVWNVGDLDGQTMAELIVTARVNQRGFREIPVQLIATDQFDLDSTPANDVSDEDDQVILEIRAPSVLSLRLFLAR